MENTKYPGVLGNKETLVETLGITYEELTPDRVVCKMPVGPKTWQPYGLLHGGASVALAETAASVGTALNINGETHYAVGLEINANHVKGKRDGIVTATAAPLHKGRTTMVWDIRITDEEDKLICVSRCTVAIVKKR
ncbi:esterase [Pueribacillus theae]|uniref:Esterase n=1 Tax=Pueribacillus theae TaxID=2171751 RepID=A0A2U1K5M8_9BACI|nr:PaaI family thioesterase [Pueribacillus theae]PWA12821.1 esterase [Pueribacillus theae]